MKIGFLRLPWAIHSLILLGLLAANPSYADDRPSVYASQRQTLASIKRSYDDIQDKQKKKLLFSPLPIGPGVSLTVIAPAEWRSLVRDVKEIVVATHARFEELFGKSPPLSTTIRLMEEDAFFLKTGAPAWTNAMYFHGEIILPIQNPKSVDLQNVRRSIRHEYAHALIHEMSAGRCPGWLDEGIAQWVEGIENPALRPALHKWLQNNRPVDLNLLQGGFTKLKDSMVPAAYAQSLFATTTLIQGYGFSSFTRYFELLKSGQTNEFAFRNSFSIHEELFEVVLERKLNEWQKANKQ